MSKSLVVYNGIPFCREDLEKIAKYECSFCQEEYKGFNVIFSSKIIEVNSTSGEMQIPFSLLLKRMLESHFEFSSDNIVLRFCNFKYSVNDLIRIGRKFEENEKDLDLVLENIKISKNNVQFMFETKDFKKYIKSVFVGFLEVYKVGKWESKNFKIEV